MIYSHIWTRFLLQIALAISPDVFDDWSWRAQIDHSHDVQSGQNSGRT